MRRRSDADETPGRQPDAGRHHSSELSYTSSDDGVWLECSCGWKKCLGFGASAHKAAAEWDKHVLTAEYHEMDEMRLAPFLKLTKFRVPPFDDGMISKQEAVRLESDIEDSGRRCRLCGQPMPED
jgi:hypothetical protein